MRSKIIRFARNRSRGYASLSDRQTPYALKPPEGETIFPVAPKRRKQSRTPDTKHPSLVGLRLLQTDDAIPFAPLAAPPEQRDTLEALEHIAALLFSAADFETRML